MTPLAIFPVDDTEQALDQGTYHYRQNGELTAIREPWCRHRHPQLGVVTRCLRSDNEHFVLAVKHWVIDGETCAELLWQTLGGVTREVRAHYRLCAGELIWQRQGGKARCLPVPKSVHFFPLMRVFTGAVITAVLEQGGRGQVLVPSIKTPQDADSLFLPLCSERVARPLAHEEPPLPHLSSCHCYLYGGDQYGEGARFWLDGRQRLQCYEWQQGDSFWQVSLDEDG